jgi:hypothetical protein
VGYATYLAYSNVPPWLSDQMERAGLLPDAHCLLSPAPETLVGLSDIDGMLVEYGDPLIDLRLGEWVGDDADALNCSVDVRHPLRPVLVRLFEHVVATEVRSLDFAEAAQGDLDWPLSYRGAFVNETLLSMRRDPVLRAVIRTERFALVVVKPIMAINRKLAQATAGSVN